jgi:DICT domain-containing protein
MEVSVMKNISLYEEIFAEMESPVEDLTGEVNEQKLRANSLKYESDIPKLEKMCYIMEKVILDKDEAEDTEIYAGFQKVSRAREIWDRFHKIADKVDTLYVFGEDDADLKPHPNIEFIYLPKEHELTREWFLVMSQPLAKSMMVAYDLDGFGVYEDEKERNFKGGKTNDPRLVETAVDLLDEVISSY